LRCTNTETAQDLDLIPGSGNIFRDLGEPDSDLRQAKAVLAAAVLRALDAQSLTVRAAAEKTGFAAADFSRVRRANLARFTLDRLIRMLQALDPGASVRLCISERNPAAPYSP
jgi:predicted XRE-type DNA-binding protein